MVAYRGLREYLGELGYQKFYCEFLIRNKKMYFKVAEFFFLNIQAILSNPLTSPAL